MKTTEKNLVLEKLKILHRSNYDLYACVECGRCTNMCPQQDRKNAITNGFNHQMRDHLTNYWCRCYKTPWVPFVFRNTKGNQLAMPAER